MVDLAGNTNIQRLGYVLDYSGVTAGPAILSQWPTSGAILSGNSFTLRGYLDDPTATVKAALVVNGSTVEIDGVVERDGLFWVENIPLTAGANSITLTMINAAAFSTVQNLSVVGSSLGLALNSLSDEELKEVFTNVSGTITDNSYSIWVNGKKATVNGDGTWNASSVYLGEGGTATFHIHAIPLSDNGGDGTPPPAGTPLNNVEAANPSSSEGVQVAVDQEEPAFVRIKQYILNDHTWSSSWNPCTEIHSNVAQDGTASHCRWVNGEGGPLSFHAQEIICGENNVPATITSDIDAYWDADNVGHIVSGGTRGTWMPPPAPVRPWEHCDIYYSWELGQGSPPQIYYYTRQAQSTVELHTGGKSLSHSMNLFAIRASAIGFNEESGIGSQDPLHNIDPTRIVIPALGKSVGNDCMLFAQLADNQTIDITPQISDEKYYEFDITATKHTLVLMANGQILTLRGEPREFCVGEKVRLNSSLDPELDSFIFYLQSETHWAIEGQFINTIIPAKGDVSPSYQTDNSLLFSPGKFQPSTTLWWYSGGGKNMSCTWRLTFRNGQTAKIREQRFVNVFRPLLYGFDYASPRSFLIVPPSPSHPVQDLKYGNDGTPPPSGVTKILHWWVYIDSKYSGQMGITQKINAKYTYYSYLFPTVPYTDLTTHGEDWLDNDEFYWHSSLVLTMLNTDKYDLHDSPGSDYGNDRSRVRLVGNFIDFIRFKPGLNEDDGNIYVTLGLVHWNMAGDVSDAAGITVNETPAPTGPVDSIEFPTWNHIINTP